MNRLFATSSLKFFDLVQEQQLFWRLSDLDSLCVAQKKNALFELI